MTKLIVGGFLVLVIICITVNTSEAQQSFPSTAFTPPDTCGTCHTDIYQQWSETILSQAYEDPFYRAVMQQAVEETGGRLSTFCIKCHSPIGVFAGEHIPVDGSKMSAIARRGVQCDFCHTISGMDGVSNGSFLNSPGNVKRGPFRDSVSPAHDTAYSVLHTRAEICGTCHDIYHPDNGLRLEATYFEWREGPYGKQNITCQDCHMTPGPGVSKPNPGRAAIQGPQREHIYTHHFVGGNALIGHRELAIERLQAAAELALELPSQVVPGRTAKLGVFVRNVGAGHYLPTSLTYLRQMWLEVRVTDANGHQLLYDEVMYNTILEDAEGVHDGSVPAWRAERIYRDYRIPPGEQVLETFTWEVPADVEGPLFVSAVLNYRSAPPEVTAKYGQPEFPVIEMTRSEAQLDVGKLPAEESGLWLQPIAGALWWIATLALSLFSLIAVFKR